MLKKLQEFFKSKKQKGQSLIFFAASAPILCAMIGAAMDFCWLYYNQSRLQNAADAAATAGASSLLEDEMPLSDYSYTILIPVNDTGLQKMVSTDKISSRIKDKGTEEKPVAGDSMAKYYAKTNLKPWMNNVSLVSDDSYDSNSQNVKFETSLYGENTDDYNSLYYTVTLTTKLEHIFGGIMETFGFDTLPSKAVSVVKISHVSQTRTTTSGSEYPHGESLYVQMKRKEVNETYPNWEEVKVQKGNNSTAANNRSVLTAGAYYGSGNINRTEVSWLNGQAFASSRSNQKTTGVDQTQFDDLFIDYQGEMNRNLTTNGDHDLQDTSKVSGNWDYCEDGSALPSNYQYNYRIHFPMMITAIYPVRSGKRPPDSLYAFIEQEPIKQAVTLSDKTTYTRGNMSSVRQIIINNDIANTNESTDRPWVIFYEGPEVPLKKYQPTLYDGDDYVGARPYLPIILNLYANFRGIIFAPNNPIIINGNGYKMEGFVVGREFRRLKLASDFQNAKYTSGSDKGFPVYTSATYNSGSYKYFVEVSNWTLKSSDPSGYKSIKVLFNGNEMTGWVKNNQWYTRDVNPDPSQYAQINVGGSTNKYALYDQLLLETKRSGKTYLVNYNGKFYIPITTESATFSNSLTSSSIGNVFSVSGKTITQTVCPVISGTNYPMYISGTKYTYTETYYNTEGVTKTKQTIMNIGDVAYEYIGTVNATTDSDGNYTETPGDYDSFTDDDKLRYDYISIFNLHTASTYNSFYNVGLVNYTYLAKSENSATSHDMFFTTYRSKHID